MRRILLISACLLCVMPTLAAKPKAKPKAKAPTVKTKTQVAPPVRVVKGTTQLAGDNAQFGVTYTLGASNPINVSVSSIEYTLGPVIFAETTYTAEAGKKLMLVHFSLQNPNSTDWFVGANQLTVTAVDSKNGNSEQILHWAIEETSDNADMQLKPGQRVNLKLLISVPDSDDIPKLMFICDDRTVLRYNTAGKVKALPARVADPKDPKGYTPYDVIPSKIGGEFIPMRSFAIRVDKVGLNPETAENGPKYVVTATLLNQTKADEILYGAMFTCTLNDTDGGQLNYDTVLWAASADRNLETTVKAGQQITVRLPFTPNEGGTVATLTIDDGLSRPVSWKL